MSKLEMSEVPIGFALALGENMEAFEAFTKMSHAQRDKILERIHGIQSRQEMHDFVANLKNFKF